MHMALKMLVHRKRPAPSRGKKAGGGQKQQKRRRRSCYKMPSTKEYSYEFKFDDDIGDDMDEFHYEFDFDSIDRYEILEDFGSSDHAVASARDRHTGQTVSIKRVRPSSGDGGAASLSAVLREARCLGACVGDPSILQLKGGMIAADDDTGDLFIVTEHLLALGGASTLRSLLTRPFSEAETRALMRQLLGAAETMHGAGVTHRDINPDNVVVGAGSGALKVCGFRCAVTPAERFVDEPHGPPLGALRYCSPDQLNGLRCYCPAEDVWAIGCVMAELLAGALLFTADTQEELLDETVELRDDLVGFGADAEVFDGEMEKLSLAGRELLAGLLAFDASERLTAADALKHRWFAENDVVKAKSRVVRFFKQR